MPDDHLIQIARSIYERHRSALDFIYEQKPVDLEVRAAELQQLASALPEVDLDDSTKQFVRFSSEEMEDHYFLQLRPAGLLDVQWPLSPLRVQEFPDLAEPRSRSRAGEGNNPADNL